MTSPHEERSEPAVVPGKAVWEPPSLTCVGKVRDLVHGQGKISGELDGDAGVVKKGQGL